jgi:hypothetical protein
MITHINQATISVRHKPNCTGNTGTVVIRLRILREIENYEGVTLAASHTVEAECSRCGMCKIVGISHPVIGSPVEVTFRPE